MRGRRHRPGTECVRHSGACSFLPRARLRCSVCGWMTADACEIEKCALRGRYGGPHASRRARGTADELKILLATKPREEQIAESVSVLIEYRQDMLYSLLRGPNAGCILTDAAPARMGVRLWALPYGCESGWPSAQRVVNSASGDQESKRGAPVDASGRCACPGSLQRCANIRRWWFCFRWVLGRRQALSRVQPLRRIADDLRVDGPRH